MPGRRREGWREGVDVRQEERGREGGREGVDARQEERGMEGGGRCQAGGEREGGRG